MSSAEKDALSPVEERHIDYILEEEFCIDPEFLRFFIERARQTSENPSGIRDSIPDHACSAVRSVTTGSGESDVLATYRSDLPLPVAILIEDKIRAGFQPNQPARYHERGRSGLGTLWSEYWTCLIAHGKYVSAPGEFDAVISLQDIQSYFAEKPDARSQFRARVLQQAITKYESTGLQKKDETITRFRQLYAAEFEASLPSDRWWHQPPRDGWWGDTWFSCGGINWPKTVMIRHQTEPGRVQLIFPIRDEVLFRKIVAEYQDSDRSGVLIDVVPVGRKKLAFQIDVSPVKDFASTEVPFEEFFAAIETLTRFYDQYSELLPAALRPLERVPSAEPPQDREVRALQNMLIGFIRSTVTRYGTEMPFPLPELSKLTATTPEEERYFPSPGLMGGFSFELLRDADGRPFVLASHWSRQWGGDSIEHRIMTDQILLVSS